MRRSRGMSGWMFVSPWPFLFFLASIFCLLSSFLCSFSPSAERSYSFPVSVVPLILPGERIARRSGTKPVRSVTQCLCIGRTKNENEHAAARVHRPWVIGEAKRGIWNNWPASSRHIPNRRTGQNFYADGVSHATLVSRLSADSNRIDRVLWLNASSIASLQDSRAHYGDLCVVKMRENETLCHSWRILRQIFSASASIDFDLPDVLHLRKR